MSTENEKYDKILEILRKSEPSLKSTEDIEKEVFERITRTHKYEFALEEIIDFVFGWVYIGWVRKSLITASLVLVMVFVYQQSVMLKRINYLSSQIVIIRGETATNPSDEFERQIMKYKLSGRITHSNDFTLSEKQIDKLLESVNELQGKYKDLLNLIQEDPELKKLVEKKLLETKHSKIKL
jgi:hypothetical protein